MAKDKMVEATTWSGKMKEFGGGNFTFLSSDGEALIFLVVGLPIKMESTYKKKKQERIGCPIVTDTGYQLFICGKRLARKLSKFEKHFTTSAMMAVRHGAEGDVNTKYDVMVCPEKETFAELLAVKESDFEESMIAESVAEAIEVMQNE